MQLKAMKVCWYHDSIPLILIFRYRIMCLRYLHRHYFEPRARHRHMPNPNPLRSLPPFFAFAIHAGVWGTAQFPFIDTDVFAYYPSTHDILTHGSRSANLDQAHIYGGQKMRFCYTASVDEANNI